MNDIKRLTIGRSSSKTVRVFARLGDSEVHWVNDDGRFRRTSCSGHGCENCADSRPQTRWTLGVIDMEDGEAKLLEVGAQIMSEIIEFTTGHPLYSFSIGVPRRQPRRLDHYDILIQNNGTFGGYKVTFYKAKPLKKSETDKVIVFLSDLAERAISVHA